MRSGTARAERFTDFFHEHVGQVRRYSSTLVAPDDVDDVVQKSMVTAWQRFESIPAESEQQWLFGVVRNHCRNTWRSGRRAEALVAAIGRARPQWSASLYENGIDPAEIDPLCEVLSELSDEDCELMVLTGWFQMTPAEIAEMSDTNPGTVRVRLSRVRQRIRNGVRERAGRGESA